jgi:drug/metabolite transporter (DMT)-like permease
MNSPAGTMRKIFTGIVGSLLILVGVILLFIPGPGILLLIAGLLVLSIEFPWARRLVERLKRWASGRRSSSQRTADPRRDESERKR